MSGLRRFSLLAGALLMVAGLAATQQSQAEERLTFGSDELEVRNLIGEFSISRHGGSEFEVIVRILGSDAEGSGVQVLREDAGDRGLLTIQFPQSGKFVYPRMGKNSKTRISLHHGEDRGWMMELFDSVFGRDITVSGGGSGLEVWADVEVRVPAGARLQVRHGVGATRVGDVRGDLELETRSGRIEVDGVDGELRVETGSGHVEVARVTGVLGVGTGSGHVEVAGVRGSETSIATGSGHVTLEQVDSPSLKVATGSGSVEASGVSTDHVQIATGSGRVRLQLDRMGGGEYAIGTGSGRVVLEIPHDASVDVHAETASGGIDLDLDGEMTVHRQERDEIEFTVGAGDARVRIGTGSGGIRIAHSR